jgi:hypothetical protein
MFQGLDFISLCLRVFISNAIIPRLFTAHEVCSEVTNGSQESAGEVIDDAEADRIRRRELAITAVRDFFKTDAMDSKRRRAKFAVKCGTSWEYLQQCMNRQRLIAPWLAINLDLDILPHLDLLVAA